MLKETDLLAGFRDILTLQRVLTDSATRTLYSQDVYRAGTLPLAVLQPTCTTEVCHLVQHALLHRIAIHVRGGGMSYTDAYLPLSEHSVVLDLSGLNKIRAISTEDLWVTAEAGCTWAALDAALKPHGVRARFWGPMSGAKATLGGGFSQGAATFGSGKHGSSASTALDFEVVLGDGRLLHTGRVGAGARDAFFRPYGPDITGLYTGDAGALGIKTAITLQLERRPKLQSSVSFAFSEFHSMRQAVSEISRCGLATEIFGLEATLARLSGGEAALAQDLLTLWQVIKSQRGFWRTLSQVTRIILGGREFLSESGYIVNILYEANSAKNLALTLSDISSLLKQHAGHEIANSIAAVVQSNPFPQPLVVGPNGMRLLPLHVILPHSAIDAFHNAFIALRQRENVLCTKHGVSLYVVFAAVGPSALLYEPVIYWEDEWLPLHHSTLPSVRPLLIKPGNINLDGRAYVETLRHTLITLMIEHGGMHLQIGRAYPYLKNRTAPFKDLITSLKSATDPQNIINPGALGLRI